MPPNFVYFDNDWDDVIFQDDSLTYDNITFDSLNEESDEETDQEIDEFYYELEDLIERPPDIYSDDHPWDNRINTMYRFKPEIWMLNVEMPPDYN